MYTQLRVDQRLIHGQVTQGWAQVLALKVIVVLSRSLAANPVAQRIMILGVPEGLQVFFLSPEQLAKRWHEWDGKEDNALILTDSLQDVLQLLTCHGSLPVVTLGNLHGDGQCHSLAPTVNCTEEEMRAIRTLLEHKVLVQSCSGANDDPQDLPVEAWQR